MSENIYDILAKFPKDKPTSFREVEQLIESVDPHDFVLEEARRLEEKFYKYKNSNGSDADGNPLDFKIAKAKRELQLAMAEYPEASSPTEALVARMGDQAEETKKVIDVAKTTIAKQQQDITKAAQAVDAANARYAAQEKRFQDFSQKVNASELDVKQQAQAALAFAQKPQASPEDIIAQIQAQTPAVAPTPATPEVEPEEPEQSPTVKPAQEKPPTTVAPVSNVVDIEAAKKAKDAEARVKKAAELKKAQQAISTPAANDIEDPFAEPTQKVAEAEHSPEERRNIARANFDIIKKGRLVSTPSTLKFGDKFLQISQLDALAIYSYLKIKSTRNKGKSNAVIDTEMWKKLILSNLNNYDIVMHLLRMPAIRNLEAAWKRELSKQRNKEQLAKQSNLDYSQSAAQQSGLANTQFGKYIQQPQQTDLFTQQKPVQRDLFGNNTMNENIKNIAEKLMERFASFKEAAKPDFLDLDKDGDTDEPMKSAAKSAKEHEPAKPDADAVAKRKRLQALKDKQEDERAEKDDYDSKSSVRTIKGRAYGGAAQKDDDKDEVDEVSKDTLRSYVGKAEDDLIQKHKAISKVPGSSPSLKHDRKMDMYKRMANVTKAYKKINKEEIDEVSYSAKAARAGKDIGKPGKAFAKIAKSAGERYGSKERGEKVAGAVLKKLRANEGEDHEGMRKPTDTPEYHTPPVDKAAAEKRKQQQAIKDRQEDQRIANQTGPLGEKAVSKAQQKFMGMVYATKKGEKAPSPAVAKAAKGMTKKAAHDFAKTKHKGLPQHVTESRNHESSEYTYETVGRILCDEQPHLDCNSEAFVKAVYDELIEMKMTPKAARWLCHYDEDFLSDCATSYNHFCRSKEKEMSECGAPMNAFVSEEPVVDAVQELDEIARLAGLAPKMEAKCESCGCEDCECNESACMIDEAAITEAATRKDFRMVADLLKAIPDMAKRTELALHHADIFKQQNPRFKREMFLAAAGVDTTPIKDESVETEGNAFTGKLAATDKGDEFELDGKKFKDTSDLEEEMETEGNEFSGALAKAKAAGEKEFEVDGKKYTVKEDINLNVSATGEEDVVNLIRKLSGMPVVAIQAQPAVAEEALEEAEVTERDIEHTNTPREVVAGTDAAIPAGADLNRAKKQYKKEYPGDNPMAVKEAIQDMLWEKYETMINDVKA